MFAFVHTILATALLCSVVVFPMKIIGNDSVNSEILDRNGKIPYATYNSCGGVIKTVCDETIILEYKPDQEYDNNEFCVWVIRNEDCDGALLTKTKSGFEVGYDYIQVSGFEEINMGQGPTYTESMGSTTDLEQISHQAPISYVIFSTDGSDTGTGFRIEIVGYRPTNYPYWSDDFYSESLSGATSLRNYTQQLRQSFVIAPTHLSVPNVMVTIDYYTISNDHLAVFTLERNGQSINFRPHSRRLSGRGSKSYVAEYYANFVILFYSYATPNIPSDAGVTISWVVSENGTTENYISSN